jgi:predicted Fe-S protein YdhL (DUF1289 family)
MTCQHLVQRRIDGHKWCRNCGALKVETGDWESPASPREPNAILENIRTQLKRLVEQLDAVLPLVGQDIPQNNPPP